MRKMKMANLWTQISEEIEKNEKEVFEKKIRVLEELKDKNPYAKAILEELQKQREKAKIFIEGKNDKYSSLNTLLTNIENMLKGQLPEHEKQVITKINEVVKVVSNNINKALENTQNKAKTTELQKSSTKTKEKSKEQVSAIIPGGNLAEITKVDIKKEKEIIREKSSPIEINKKEKSFENQLSEIQVQKVVEKQVEDKQNIFDLNLKPKEEEKSRTKSQEMDLSR